MKERGEFLESAEVFGNYYGTACQSLADAQAAGNDLLLDIDVQGAVQVRERVPDAVSIFVLPPNPETLKERLRNRSIAEGKLDEAEIGRRLAKARGEIENYRQYRYILINDILEDAVEALTAIVITERALRDGAPPDPETARMMPTIHRQVPPRKLERPFGSSALLLRPDRHARHSRLKAGNKLKEEAR